MRAESARPNAGSGASTGAVGGFPVTRAAEKSGEEPAADGFQGWTAGCYHGDVYFDCRTAESD